MSALAGEHDELIGIAGWRDAAGIAVTVPDTTPDGPFTPSDESLAIVWVSEAVPPWPIVRRFAEFLTATGDLVTRDIRIARGWRSELVPQRLAVSRSDLWAGEGS
ncbi:hypothetical protein [Catelliglobosispora koreensis]|uniref:hypothetical protein n=1 Tax=Catelliglobosispora koreensis TaxID=129052 RepID=UPI0003674A2D|nr:hypothetical protein [Catelliglobosispora koreensis]